MQSSVNGEPNISEEIALSGSFDYARKALALLRTPSSQRHGFEKGKEL